MTSSEWCNEMQRLRDVKPRPITKLYGKRGPTPEQLESWTQQMREWNRAYRKASKMQKETLDAENAEWRRRHPISV